MGVTFRTLVLTVILAQPFAAAALDPSKAVTQYLLDSWGPVDGLPAATVFETLQTRDGYLWLATEGGLVRFDGVSFHTFTRATTPAMGSNIIRCLYEDRGGALWIGTTGGGVLRRKDGAFLSWTARSGLSHDIVRSIVQDRRGRIWLGTLNGLDYFEGDDLVHGTLREGLPNPQIRTLFTDSQDRLWVAGEGYVARLEGERCLPVQAMPSNFVQQFCEDRTGNLWAATMTGLMRWQGGRFVPAGLPRDFDSVRIATLFEDPEGCLWIGTSHQGLIRFHHGQTERLTAAQGLLSDWIRGLSMDREGSLWIATNGGLCRLKEGKFTLIGSLEGLASDSVWSMLQDRTGRIWIGSEGGLNCFEDGRIRAVEGLPPGAVNTMVEDAQGRLWVHVYGRGLWERSERGFHPVRIPGLDPQLILQALYAGREGTLWMGSIASGILRFREGRVKVYSAAEGMEGSAIRCMLEDRFGTLWIGSDGGLGKLEGDRVRMLTEADGWAANLVYALREDSEGDLWIGTINDGLIMHRDRLFLPVTNRHGLHDNSVYSILEDRSGYLWMDCLSGIYRASLKELKEAALGRLPRIRCTVFGRADGMRSEECNGGTQPSALIARDGRLWFPTMRGIVIADPARTSANALPPPVIVEALRVDGNVSVPPFAEAFGPGAEKLEIQYTALSLLWPERVRFRYQLEGYDRHWVDAGGRREAFYTNLAPGNYAFRVQACNNDGVWNEEGAAVEFRLRPYFHQTAGFLALLALAGTGAIAGFLRWRMVRLRRKSQELEMLVSKRTRELQEAREKSDALLHNILPAEIARELRERGVIQPRAYSSATILFTDFKGFSVITSTLPAEALVRELNEIYIQFDDILERHGLEKIKTIGDSYMVAGGVPAERPDHALACVLAALEMQAFIAERNRASAIKWHMRAGVHSGQIIAGVVGRTKFTYDLYGDTVNIASRMEHACEPGRVNISAFTYHLVQGRVAAEYRGKIDIKGKGEVDMYYVVEPHAENTV